MRSENSVTAEGIGLMLQPIYNTYCDTAELKMWNCIIRIKYMYNHGRQSSVPH